MSSVISPQRSKESSAGTTLGRGSVTLIRTKLLPPVARSGRVPRQRLQALLTAVGERPLTIIRAPGGFGKTTLALAWVEELRSSGDTVAWLSLDNDDNEPRRFICYAIAALHEASPDIGQESRMGANGAPLHQLEAMLVNEIADCGDEIFFFLDDYSVISHEAVHEFLIFLLRHAPSNLHIVLVSRSDPPLELGSLRARGELLEIDASRLLFTLDETKEFLAMTAPADLGSADVGTIHRLTEGWPAALRITALSFEAGRDPADLLRSLARSPRSIGGFLDELCSLLPPPLLEFMQQTAIVERLSASLCDGITGRSDSAARLAGLEQQQLISPLDDQHTQFAYHQLFREYLLQRLAERRGGEVADLHRRASDWYATHGFGSESVRHLLEAGDTEGALVRIAECAQGMVERGDLLTLLNWQRQLNAKFIQQPIPLQLAIIWAEALSLSGTEALQHIAAVERAADELPEIDAAAVRHECLALGAVAAALADDPARADELAAAYHAEPDDAAMSRGSVRNVERFVHLNAARWEDFYAVPTVPCEDSADVMPAVYQANIIGLAELAQARAGPAEQMFLQSLGLGRRLRRFAGAIGMAKGAYAELLYETGRTAEAEALLRDDLDLIAGGVTLDTVLRGLRTAARLAWRRGQAQQAADLLERAESVGLARDWPRLVAAALFERLRLALRQGLTTSSLALLKRLQQLSASAEGSARRSVEGVPHYGAMAQAVVDLEQNRPRQAVAMLTPLFEDAVDCGANLLAIRVGALLARAHLLARATPHGLRVFNQVIDLAQPSCFIGSIADDGPEILQLIDLVDRGGMRAEQDERQAFLGKLHESAARVWDPSRVAGAAGTRDLPSPLTPRECDVLELIAEGQSNKAIARRLGLGPETVKTHLKNVFLKLEVERRTQAVLRAEELGLLRVRRLRRS